MPPFPAVISDHRAILPLRRPPTIVARRSPAHLPRRPAPRALATVDGDATPSRQSLRRAPFAVRSPTCRACFPRHGDLAHLFSAARQADGPRSAVLAHRKALRQATASGYFEHRLERAGGTAEKLENSGGGVEVYESWWGRTFGRPRIVRSPGSDMRSTLYRLLRIASTTFPPARSPRVRGCRNCRSAVRPVFRSAPVSREKCLSMSEPVFVLVRPQMGENIGAAARGMVGTSASNACASSPRATAGEPEGDRHGERRGATSRRGQADRNHRRGGRGPRISSSPQNRPPPPRPRPDEGRLTPPRSAMA